MNSIKAVVFDAYGTLYDIQSVASVTEDAFPGYGEIITQVWRIKQLEYTWLRSLMRRYEDFSVVTRESLAYTLKVLGLNNDVHAFDVTSLENPMLYFWHHLEFNKPATDQAIDAVREFLHATVGGKEQAP